MLIGTKQIHRPGLGVVTPREQAARVDDAANRLRARAVDFADEDAPAGDRLGCEHIEVAAQCRRSFGEDQ
jgi:hypothetical protein